MIYFFSIISIYLVDMIAPQTEDYPNARLFALTQTLLPKHTLKRSLNQQLFDLRTMLHDKLKAFCYKYEMYIEQHQSGNLHAHVICWVKDNVKRCKLLKRMNDGIGNTLWKPIDDLLKWKEYCSKDGQLMADVLGIVMPIRWELKPIKFDMMKKLGCYITDDLTSSDSDSEDIKYELAIPSSNSV